MHTVNTYVYGYTYRLLLLLLAQTTHLICLMLPAPENGVITLILRLPGDEWPTRVHVSGHRDWLLDVTAKTTNLILHSRKAEGKLSSSGAMLL